MLILICYLLIYKAYAHDITNGTAVAVVIEMNASVIHPNQIPPFIPSLIPIFRPFNFSEGEGVVSLNKSQDNENSTIETVELSSDQIQLSKVHVPTTQVNKLHRR